ncbi:MAG: OsmC family protein [Owenweeksia sp.]
MAETSSIIYQGALRTKATHQRSGNELITDAPLDNNGRGEAFSPTDLVATALGSCMLTVMGIKARAMGFDLEDATASITKIMASAPRRIAEIQVHIRLKQNCDEPTRELLEETGRKCPVAQSLSSDLKQRISFEWVKE